MTTAREHMKQLSGLIGAHSARDHFLAITQGTGTGVDRLIFASSMVVSIEESKIVATHRPKREVREDYRPAINRLSAGVKKSVSIFTREASLSVLTKPDELFIRQGKVESVVVRDLGKERFTVRQSDVLEMN